MSATEKCYLFSILLNLTLLTIVLYAIIEDIDRIRKIKRNNRKRAQILRKMRRERLVEANKDFNKVYYEIIGR